MAQGLKMNQVRPDIDSRKEAEEERIERIKGALRYAIVLVGLREHNFPNELEKGVLVDYITRAFGTHTAAELKLAFDMAIGGLLNVDPTCYENFTPAYVGKIMNAYRKWAAQEHSQKMRENEAKEAQESNKSNEAVDWSTEWSTIVKRAKNGQICKELIPTDIYDWLGRMGKYPAGPDADKEELKEWNNEKWRVLFECMEQYLFDMKRAVASNEEQGIVTPAEIKTLIELMECVECNTDGVILDQHPWLKNPIIMSHLTIMSKQELIRQIAVSEAAEL